MPVCQVPQLKYIQGVMSAFREVKLDVCRVHLRKGLKQNWLLNSLPDMLNFGIMAFPA